jgi:hypothetical protein
MEFCNSLYIAGMFSVFNPAKERQMRKIDYLHSVTDDLTRPSLLSPYRPRQSEG